MEKRIELNINRQKAMIIPDRTCKKQVIVTVTSKHVCKIKVTDYFLVPFLDQQQSYFVVSAMIYFGVYTYLVTEWKHGISINEHFKSNKTLENLST